MGVQGLWDLVSPAGQRVNLSALENKIIAVDASIWLYHFLKAMRDEHGNMVKGAHLVGFFRRICKLLYLKIKPVFVFDGPPPRLKLNTLRQRAQHRDTEERNRRKAVEKLLRNQLKMHVLEATMGSAQESSGASGSSAPPGNSGDAAGTFREEDELAVDAAAGDAGTGDAGTGDAGDGEDSDKSTGSQVEEVPPDVPQGGRRWQRQRWRRRQGGTVPEAFRGFMAKRRGVSEVTLPELPDEPLRDILQVPDRRRGRTSRMSEPDEWKGYVLPGGGMVTIPLDGPVALEDFQMLSPKTKYTLLQRAQEAWYGESRLKAVAAKDDMGAFVNVQLETFLRHIRTNKEIEKVKRAMAQESKPSGNNGIAEGDVYTPPSWLQPTNDSTPSNGAPTQRGTSDDRPRAAVDKLSAVIDELAVPAAAADSADAPAGRAPRRKGRGRGSFRQLNGSEVARLKPVGHLNAALLNCLGDEEEHTVSSYATRKDEEHAPKLHSVDKPMTEQATNSVDDLFGQDFFQSNEDAEVFAAMGGSEARTEIATASANANSVDDLFGQDFFHSNEDAEVCTAMGGFEARTERATSSANVKSVDDLFGPDFFPGDEEEEDIPPAHADACLHRSLTESPSPGGLQHNVSHAESSSQENVHKFASASPERESFVFHTSQLTSDTLNHGRSSSSSREQRMEPTPHITEDLDIETNSCMLREDEVMHDKAGEGMCNTNSKSKNIINDSTGHELHAGNKSSCGTVRAAREFDFSGEDCTSVPALDLAKPKPILEVEAVALTKVQSKTELESHIKTQEDRSKPSCSQAQSRQGQDRSRSRSAEPHPRASDATKPVPTPQAIHHRRRSASSGEKRMEPALHLMEDSDIEMESGMLREDELIDSEAGGGGACNTDIKNSVFVCHDNDVITDSTVHMTNSGNESTCDTVAAAKAYKFTAQVESDASGESCTNMPVLELAKPTPAREVELQSEGEAVTQIEVQSKLQLEQQSKSQENTPNPTCSQAQSRQSPDRSQSRSAEPDLLASDATKPIPTPQAIGHRQRQVIAGKPKADSWCSVHFQYSWRCCQDGLDCAAAAADAQSSSAGPPAKKRPVTGSARASDATREDVGDVGGLADEDMEDLEFQRMQAELEDERRELQGDVNRAKRNLETVTPEMQADVERLLEAFGIPFIHSPAEAEAQCVFLAEANLVDAVATDDSDALVFGAREIYRRLFSDDHMVECYTARRVEDKLGLLRNDLIALAMLLGCDYSLGIHGVGIVNGLEIVRAFAPGQRGLEQAEAAAWMEQLGRLQSWAQNVADWGHDSAGVDASDPKCLADFKVTHRNFRTQWSFPTPFPHLEVFKAFTDPVVDSSLEQPTWGPVDNDKVIRQMVGATGLGEDKLRERLDPALQRYKDTLRQPRITEYMVPTGVGDVAVVRSSRMRDALRGLRGETSPDQPGPEQAVGGDPEAARPTKRRKPAAKSSWTLRPSEGGPIELDLDL